MRGEPLPHLDTFAHVAELNSFTAAARELGISQAAVSQRIQALEKELDSSLFDRRAGRIQLSEAGRRLYPLARQILNLHQEARTQVTGVKGPVTGELLLGASSIPGEYLLPQLLEEFRERQPQVQVRALISDSAAIQAEVERGQVQLGLIGAKPDRPNLESVRFGGDSLLLIVPGNHPWHKKRTITLSSLLEQPLILRERGSGARSCLERAIEKLGHAASEIKVILELGSNEAIKEAVHRGLGVAILSRLAVQ